MRPRRTVRQWLADVATTVAGPIAATVFATSTATNTELLFATG